MATTPSDRAHVIVEEDVCWLAVPEDVRLARGDLVTARPALGWHTATTRAAYTVEVLGDASPPRDLAAAHEKRMHAAAMAGGPAYEEATADAEAYCWAALFPAGVRSRKYRARIVGRTTLPEPGWGDEPAPFDW